MTPSARYDDCSRPFARGEQARVSNRTRFNMNWMRPSLLCGMTAMTVVMVFSLAYFVVGAQQPAREQQTTGTPGSPSATTTIDTSHLPPAPPPFGGVISLQADQSKPYWPLTVVPPTFAPHVLLIMTDDQGYSYNL